MTEGTHYLHECNSLIKHKKALTENYVEFPNGRYTSSRAFPGN